MFVRPIDTFKRITHSISGAATLESGMISELGEGHHFPILLSIQIESYTPESAIMHLKEAYQRALNTLEDPSFKAP